jgi:hypothetical protein
VLEGADPALLLSFSLSGVDLVLRDGTVEAAEVGCL